VKDIPSEKLFRHLPEQTGEKSRLKSGFELDFLVGNDFVNQETHPKSEEERDKVFQNESNDRDHVQKGAKTVTLDNRDHGGEHHTGEKKGPCQNNHEKIDSLSAKDTATLVSLKNHIQSCPQ
jgi:hypothetical protein